MVILHMINFWNNKEVEKMKNIYIKEKSIIYYIISSTIFIIGLVSFIVLASECEDTSILIVSKIIAMVAIALDIIVFKKFEKIVR